MQLELISRNFCAHFIKVDEWIWCYFLFAALLSCSVKWSHLSCTPKHEQVSRIKSIFYCTLLMHVCALLLNIWFFEWCTPIKHLEPYNKHPHSSLLPTMKKEETRHAHLTSDRVMHIWLINAIWWTELNHRNSK